MNDSAAILRQMLVQQAKNSEMAEASGSNDAPWHRNRCRALQDAIDSLEADRKAREGWVLTMRSGVSDLNDNVIGTFHDYVTALWVGGVLFDADKMDHPEYRTFDVIAAAPHKEPKP